MTKKIIRCYYRLCDKARYGPNYTWDKCFTNFLNNFNPNPQELKVYIDNCSDETIQKVSEICKTNRFEYTIINLGNKLSFWKTVQDSLSNKDNTIIYFIESDYIHRKYSKEALFDIFEHFGKNNYVSLYDHPDKYHPYFWNTNINLFLRNYCEVEEFKSFKSEIHYLKSGWWRTSPTSCMSFAAEVNTIKDDIELLKHISIESDAYGPRDVLFFEKIKSKEKKLFTPIPSYSGHTILLPTGIDWKTI